MVKTTLALGVVLALGTASIALAQVENSVGQPLRLVPQTGHYIQLAQDNSSSNSTGTNNAAKINGNGALNTKDTSTENKNVHAGSNSFTEAQAQTRIENAGYTGVKNLSKDSNSVWHGMAMKDGHSIPVALDYKGNVTEGSKATNDPAGSTNSNNTPSNTHN